MIPEPSAYGYNHNGIVDAADYVVWRKSDGTQAGYSTGRTHCCQSFSVGSGSGAGANAVVPESATVALLLSAAAQC